MINAFNKASTQHRLHFNSKLTPEIKNKIKLRNQIRRTWQTTKDPSLKSQLKKLNNTIKSLIQTHKNSKWEQYTDSLSDNNKKYWKKVKSMRAQHTNIPPLEKDADNIAISPADKAEAIADCWKHQFEQNPNMSHEFTNNLIASETNNYLATPHVNFNYNITAQEIIEFINTLDPHKATGHDKINNNMIRHLPLKFIWWLISDKPIVPWSISGRHNSLNVAHHLFSEIDIHREYGYGRRITVYHQG
ncbi:putative RNA-directed DNA polymerase from transposon X-element [Caerostris extrusa]|uniref:RNA-directed DNA polymerase from transposon X-element n=1 Tax=Caerostris extrusa TaxID=172846 RepID=A0AAV4RG67_CAEEX|nr:putative RNA-directed DNA polymerase from transposon X-element [Caerostris extrusa]